MIIIRRVGDDKYQLESDTGDIIETYQTNRMDHPSDWIADAENAGESVHGPYDWEYIDDHNSE